MQYQIISIFISEEKANIRFTANPCSPKSPLHWFFSHYVVEEAKLGGPEFAKRCLESMDGLQSASCEKI